MLAAALGRMVGYHQLDFRAAGVMQGHRVAGIEEVKAGCASFECGEKLKDMNSIQSQPLCWISLKLDQVTFTMVFLRDVWLGIWLFQRNKNRAVSSYCGRK